MAIATYEATVENGQIKPPPTVHLPERAVVYVVVPDVQVPATIHLRSPCLAKRELAVDFLQEVTEEPREASRRL